MTKNEVTQYANDNEVEILLFENPSYDNAIIGITNDNRVIYDFDLMIKDLMKQDNIGEIEAIEFIEYNTIRSLSYYDNAPIVLMTKEY